MGSFPQVEVNIKECWNHHQHNNLQNQILFSAIFGVGETLTLITLRVCDGTGSCLAVTWFAQLEVIVYRYQNDC